MIPPSLDPNLAPGGLVMVTFDRNDREIVRSILRENDPALIDQLALDAAEAHGQHGGGGTLVAYDGDDGGQVWNSGHFPDTTPEGMFLTPQLHQFETLMGLTPQSKGIAYEWPWMVVGVFGTDETIKPDEGEDGSEWWHSFVYTVGVGPYDLWAPSASIEGRYAGHDLVGWVLNVFAYCLNIGYLNPGESVIVPLGVPGGEDVGTVWWIGHPDNDIRRYQAYQSRALGVIPIRWSSGLGWKEGDDDGTA